MERQVSIDIVDSPAVVDAFPFRLMVAAMLGWLDRRQQETVAYPMEENRLLRKLAYLRSRASSKESLSLSVFSDLVDRFTAGLFGLATESVDTAALHGTSSWRGLGTATEVSPTAHITVPR